MVLLDPPELRDLILFNLEAKLKVEIVEAGSEAEAIGLFLTAKDWDLVIFDGDMEWPDFTDFLREKKVAVSLVSLLLKEKRPIGNFAGMNILDMIPKPKLLERLPIVLHQYMKEHPDRAKTTLEQGPLDLLHCRIPTRLLLKVGALRSDIYIRLSGSKYLKLFLKGDIFDSKDLEKYLVSKKVKFLYLLNNETAEFISKLEKELILSLTSKSNSVKEMTAVAQAAVDTVHELSNRIGFTPEVKALVKTTTKLVATLTARSPKFSSLFALLEKNKDQYISAHSIGVAQISCSIASAMGWSSEATFQKLTMAAMLHDITLSNQALATVQTLKELNERKNEFTEAEYLGFQSHPSQAASIAQEFTEIPPDVDLIISQHHEAPDESGFPRKLPALRISPLASLFIVAHDIVDIALKNEAPFSLKEVTVQLKKKYSAGHFKRVIAALEKVKM